MNSKETNSKLTLSILTPFLTLSLLLLLIGCSYIPHSVNYLNIASNQQKIKPESGFLSFVADYKSGFNIRVDFFNKAEERTYRVKLEENHYRFDQKYPYLVEDAQGMQDSEPKFITLIELPPGDYDITFVYLKANDVQKSNLIANKQPIKIDSKAITDIGELEYDIVLGPLLIPNRTRIRTKAPIADEFLRRTALPGAEQLKIFHTPVAIDAIRGFKYEDRGEINAKPLD